MIGGENSGNESEDRSDPFMTPSHSTSSLVDEENNADATPPTYKTESRNIEHEVSATKMVPESSGRGESSTAGGVSHDDPASAVAPKDSAPMFSGGEMVKNPSFLALLFLGKLANVVRKKQRYAYNLD